jgi:hypothetical protein
MSIVVTKLCSMNSTVKRLIMNMSKKTNSTWLKSTYIIGEVTDEYLLFL